MKDWRGKSAWAAAEDRKPRSTTTPKKKFWLSSSLMKNGCLPKNSDNDCKHKEEKALLEKEQASNRWRPEQKMKKPRGQSKNASY